MNCQFCGQALPEGARFCFKCHRQIVCLSCGKPLIDGAEICVYCGQGVGSKSSEVGLNHILFKEEDGGKRSFEASFSDETAGNVASVFARIVNGEIGQKGAEHLQLIDRPAMGNQILLRDDHYDSVCEKSAIRPSEDSDLKRIFRSKEGKASLVEKRLKAKTKIDYQARVCMLYLLYYQQYMQDSPTREDLSAFMAENNLNDSSFRGWLSKNSHFFLRDDSVIELSPEGEEKAMAFLKEVFDDSIESGWKPGPAGASAAKTKSNESKSSQPQMIPDLDLTPAGKESLVDFLNRHHYRKSSSQQNLLFVYYLTQVLSLSGVNQDHVYTCYRKLGIKLPSDLYHSLSDNISKYRWMMNMSDLKLTTAGLNFVEHDMVGQ